MRLPVVAAAALVACAQGVPPDPRVEDDQPARRAACAYDAGALPAETFAPWEPRGREIPIDTIVVLLQENRSFDHYFGMLPAFGQPGAEGIPPGYSNPDASGTQVPAFHTSELCVDDVHHSWAASHAQWNGGLNDGFVVTNDPGGTRALGYFDGTDLPFYYDLATTFAVGDRFFCSLLGPTWPNRMYHMAATSWGVIRNEFPEPHLTIFHLLERARVSWKSYVTDGSPVAIFPEFHLAHLDRLRDISEYFADAAAGTLPSVVWVSPEHVGRADRTDEHPPGLPQVGERWVYEVVQALMDSPQWPHAALLLTYDEHGGFFNHVPPPEACAPDDLPPLLEGDDPPGGFDRLGFRVPAVVVSPYAKPGYVSHVVHDLTSVLRFIEARFELPALTRRDANANPMLDFFDFTEPAFLVPPELTPPNDVSAQQSACLERYPEITDLFGR